MFLSNESKTIENKAKFDATFFTCECKIIENKAWFDVKVCIFHFVFWA
jgi:hypothetical protein